MARNPNGILIAYISSVLAFTQNLMETYQVYVSSRTTPSTKLDPVQELW